MAVEAATAMSVAVANDAMAAAEEEVPVAIEATGVRAYMVATEGAVAMVATAADTAAVTATATTTISRHTVFKARWLSIFLCLLASTL